MAYKFHHAAVTQNQQDAVLNNSASYSSSVIVYDTKYSYPSEGIEYIIHDENMDSGIAGPTNFGENKEGFVLRGNTNSMVFDYIGGNPPAVTTPFWQICLQGHIYGCSTSNPDMTFKFIYSGSIRVSVNNSSGDLATTNDLDTVIYDDWEPDNNTGIKTAIVETTITNGIFSVFGAFPLLVRYWNSSDNPHLVAMIKRDGIDDDFSNKLVTIS